MTSLRGWMVPLILLGVSAYALAEDLTLTTYYPSPRGVYRELRTAGPVKIGDTSSAAAQARLEVHGAGADFTTTSLLVTNNSSAPLLAIRDNGVVGIGVNDPTATGRLVVLGGKVGIGTIDPAVLLHIVTTSPAGNSVQEVLRVTHADSDSAGASGIGARLSYTLESTVDDTFPEAARIEAVLDDATNTSKDASLRFYVLGPNAAAGVNTPTEWMRIDSAGNVGIGTTSPAPYRLKVAGPTGLDDVVTLTNTDAAKRRITNVATPPLVDSDVVTKAYVDAAAGGGSVIELICPWMTAGCGFANPSSCVPASCSGGWTDQGVGCAVTALSASSLCSVPMGAGGFCKRTCTK